VLHIFEFREFPEGRWRCDMEPKNLIFSPKRASDWLGLSQSTLAKMRLSGAGPTYVKLGARRVGYLEKDLAEWVEANRFRSTSQYGS